MSNKELSGKEIDNNISLIDICSQLLHQLAFGSEASGLLTAKEKNNCNLINKFLKRSMREQAYYVAGFNFKANTFCTYLFTLVAEQQIRLADIASSLSKIGIGAELTRLEQLEALQKKILRSRKKMEPVAFTRLLEHVNRSMINREYVSPKFDFDLDEMRKEFKQGMLPVRFEPGTRDNVGNSKDYRKKVEEQLRNKKRM